MSSVFSLYLVTLNVSFQVWGQGGRPETTSGNSAAFFSRSNTAIRTYAAIATSNILGASAKYITTTLTPDALLLPPEQLASVPEHA